MDQRKRAAALLLKALEQDNPHLDEYTTEYLAWLAGQLAEALDQSSASASQSYASRIRAVCFNLPKPHNDELRLQLCNRSLSPEAFCAMHHSMWVSKERRAELQADSAKRLKACIVDTTAGALRTNSQLCPECGWSEALVFHLGVRRDIGKCETWGSKDSDDVATRLQCCKCQNEWVVENFSGVT